MGLLVSFKNAFFQDILRIFPLLSKRLRINAAVCGLFMFFQSVLELAFILALTSMASALTTSEILRESFFYQGLFALSPSLEEWTVEPKQLLILAVIILVVVCIIKNIVSFITARLEAMLGEDISLEVGKEIMERFLYKDYAWHLSAESNTMFQRMLWRPHLSNLLSNLLMMYATAFTVLLLFLSLMGQEPLLTSLVVFMTLAVGIIFFKSMRAQLDYNAKLVAEASQSETKTLLCAVKGIREVLIYRQQETFLKELMNASYRGRIPRTFNFVIPTAPSWILEVVGFIMVLISVMVLVFVENASIERISTALSLLVLTAWRVLPYCNRIVSLQISIRSLRPTATSVIKLLEKLRQQPSVLFAEPDPNFTFDSSISLHDVSFCYSKELGYCLKNINMEIKKGERIGLIGASGGGKSTLAGVISGLLPTTEGHICVDGKKLNPRRTAALASKIGYVPQTPFLFAGTLAENVAFSEWGKALNMERVKEACSKAAMESFINYFPRRYNMIIGENGGGLSGGQAQRVSIARAMYTNPSLLIFDEATSALDQHNEKLIQTTIDSLAENVTCLIIAHRLSTVEKCDRIIWIERGEVVMVGDASEVLAKYKPAE